MPPKSRTSEVRTSPLLSQHEPACFLGRERESKRIEKAFRKKESMVISGPTDIGKTALIQSVLRALPADIGARCLYLASCRDLQDLLRKLVTLVYQARNPALRRQLHAEGISSINFGFWLKSMPSPRLKGALYRAVEKNGYRLILDHVPRLTHPITKVIKELLWMRDTPVFLLVRDGPRYKVDQLSPLIYPGGSERLCLAPLPTPVAGDLLDRCIKRFGLSGFDQGRFRKEVLDLSGGVPGAIVKMCAFAADPRYQQGAQIKTKLLHIDYLTSGQSRREPATLWRSAGDLR